MTPVYDADGNLTDDGRWLYTWDAQNRLIRMETTTAATTAGHPYTKLTFRYDWQGRRLERAVWKGGTAASPTFSSRRRWLYDGRNPIAEFDSDEEGTTNTRLKTFTWGLDLSGTLQGAGGVGGLIVQTDVSGSVKRRASYDGNGNIVAWTRSNQSGPDYRCEYDAFGNTLVSEGTSSSEYGFSTKQQDAETGLYYYGYRYYDAVHGRWLNRDPIEEQGGFNLYSFVKNNAINQVDYLGFSVFKVAFKGAGDIDPQRAFTSFTSNLYSSRDVSSALKSIIDHYDKDGDKRLTSKDCPPFRVKIVGYSWGGISALYLVKQLGEKTENPDKNLYVGIGTLDPVTTLRASGGSAVGGGLPKWVRKAFNDYQTNGMWRSDRLGVFGAGAFKGNNVSGAINLDRSHERPGLPWSELGDPKKPWEDHISIQRYGYSLVDRVQSITLAGEDNQ